jgi:hypothetical protein
MYGLKIAVLYRETQNRQGSSLASNAPLWLLSISSKLYAERWLSFLANGRFQIQGVKRSAHLIKAVPGVRV